MTTPIRWGLMATGGIARAFAHDLRLLPDAELVAVGSRTPEGAKAFATEFDVPRAHGTYAELAADPEVDAVYVSPPHPGHAAATIAALEQGKAVLCEKPFTLDLATSTELVSLARDRGLLSAELSVPAFAGFNLVLILSGVRTAAGFAVGGVADRCRQLRQRGHAIWQEMR